jgi:hypothetical protein
MLNFNPGRIFRLRGIERPNNFLVKNGFTPMIASRLMSPLTNVKVGTVGRLCELLNCTPNDLFDWTPSSDSTIPETHALKELVREDAVHLIDLLKDIPAEKLADLHAMIDQLRKT